MQKKPTQVIITDLHLDKNNTSYVESLMEEVVSYCLDSDIEEITLLGDSFTDRSSQKLEVLLSFKRIVKIVTRNNINLFVIPGNHDKVILDNDSSYLDIFDIERCYILRKPYNVDDGEIHYHYLPYYNTEKTEELIKQIKCDKDNKHILFCHLAIDGVKNNDGSIVSDSISLKELEKFSIVFTGHYHDRTVVGENVVYIGSLFPHNYGEDNDKGFCVLYDDGTFEFKLVNFKKYKKLNIDLEQVSTEKVQKLKNKYANSEHNIRFIFSGTPDLLATIDKKEFTRLKIDVKKESKSLIENIEQAENTEILQYDKKTIIKLFMEYSKDVKLEPAQKILGVKYFQKK
jgi:exonuclease SbcD